MRLPNAGKYLLKIIFYNIMNLNQIIKKIYYFIKTNFDLVE